MQYAFQRVGSLQSFTCCANCYCALTIQAMARIRITHRGSFVCSVSVSSADQCDGDGFSSIDVTIEGGGIAESAHVEITHTGNEECFSGPIRIAEPRREIKLPHTGEAAAVSDAEEATNEVHHTNQEQSEPLSSFPERSPSISLKRRQRTATTGVSGSGSKRVRDGNWTREETEILNACKSDPSLPKGKQGWEEIAARIPTRDALQCRQRWDTLQKNARRKPTTLTSSGRPRNEVNGASTSSSRVGKPNLPSRAYLSDEVRRPAAIPVELTLAAAEIEAPILQRPIPELPDVAQHALLTTVSATAEPFHPDAMAAKHVDDYNDTIASWLRDWNDDNTHACMYGA